MKSTVKCGEVQILGKDIKNQYNMHEVTEGRLISENACCQSVRKLLSWPLISTNIKLEMKYTEVYIILRVVSSMCISLREKHTLECPTTVCGGRYLN